MNFDWNEQQTAVSELAGKILGAEVSEASLREVEKAGTFFHARAWQKLAEAGLLGVAIEDAHGGMAGGVLDLCALMVQVGRHVAPVPAFACLALGALPVQKFGNEAQKARLLPGVSAGTTFLSGAWAEGAHGSLAQTTTSAEPAGDGFRLRGAKDCVALADRAERIVVSARQADRVGLFLVDPGAEGVKLTRGVATHGEALFHVELDGVLVRKDDVLVAPEDTRARAALAFVEQAATACATAISVGVATRALEITAKYTVERKQFGVPIGSFQAVRQRAADAYIDVAAMRLTMMQAAYLVDAGHDAALAAQVAKHQACEGGYRVTYAAQHLHGGMGYDTDYPLHRYYLWAKALELTLGTAPESLARIGRALAG
jgi:alkylation response protein AidB-like acyl-CoA dehydrogenase